LNGGSLSSEQIDFYDLTVIFIRYSREVSAYEVAQQISQFGDIYCVKDSA
jgi:hypothetical protein